MDRDSYQLESFARRAFIIGAGQGLVLTILGGRLAWLQIAQGEKYATLAENNRVNLRILPPSRGQIVDRFGVPLAINLQNFQVVVIPEQVENLEKTLRDLQQIITVSESDIKRALRDSKRNARFVALQVRDNLSWDEVSKIEINLPDLPGVSVQDGEVRSYPYKEATAHLIGYVGRVNEKEITKDPLLLVPGFLIGKNGLEKSHDADLIGSAGKAEIEVNVHGREVRQLNRIPSKPGNRLTLSIDAELQRFVQQRLALERSASAVIMDVHTGSVYALASHPSFNPNSFSRGISAMEWEQLRDDPAHPLNNKVVSGLYPPGSTFKMVTALAGLEAGVIDQNWSVFCPGHYDFGNTRFHCWKKGGHGTVNLTKALAESCDVFFYKMSTNLGIDRIAQMARRLGMGQKLDIGLPEEKAGLVPDQKWKKTTKNESWHQGETIIASIGQGYLLTTPLQLATMVSRLVNGGKAVSPWVAGYSGDKAIETGTFESLGLRQDYLEMICNGMERVMMPGGTAYSQRITQSGMEMGGKTGTAQVKRITKAERAAGVRQEDMPWHFRHHALFVGYAPIVNPRYACAVVVEHGGGGSAVAAPVAKEILLECQRRDPAQKKMEPA
jgi:penicillin-binding protein 2